jgi:hypothetical protein
MFEMTIAPADLKPEFCNAKAFVYAQRGCNAIITVIMIILFSISSAAT